MGVLSLKNKMTLMVSLLMAGMLSLMAFLAFRFFELKLQTTIAGQQLSLVGIRLFPTDGSDPDTLIKKADAAMYRIKKAGEKNRFVFFSHPT